jgi:hypothetical protein
LEFVTFRTGTNGPVLQTRTFTLPPPSAQTPVFFEFGFASAERPGAGVIFDSFSIAVEGAPGFSQLVTIDANGAVWAPQTPGTVPVPGEALSWQQTQFRGATDGMDVYGAYQFTFAIPELWAGHALSFHLDMFDNHDNVGSLAYGGMTAIPEPSVLALFLVGLATHFLRRLNANR